MLKSKIYFLKQVLKKNDFFDIENLQKEFNCSKNETKIIKEVIDILKDLRVLYKTMEGKYYVDLRNKVIGEFKKNKKGFGFIKSYANEEDYYVYNTNMKGALSKDIVFATIKYKKTKDKNAEAVIEEILYKEKVKIVGTFVNFGRYGGVVPIGGDISDGIIIREGNTMNAHDNAKVVVEITERNPNSCEGVIIEIVKEENINDLDIFALLKERNVEIDFSEETYKELEKLEDKITDEELKGRVDLTNELIITIDNEDAKDLDDAISIKKKENGNYLLGVHIADVSHYVQKGTALDSDALSRATSIYLVDRVIPMIPQKLSNGLCSLHPNVDRLTVSCFMEINNIGEVVSYRIVKSVINSKERMTYNNVYKILEDEDEELINKYKHIHELLLNCKELALILIKKRELRGALDFNFSESQVILNEDGTIKEIKKLERNIATRIIEEFMIVCNEVIAGEMFRKNIPFVYRVHEKPEKDKIALFSNFINQYNLYTPDNLKLHDLKKVLEEVKDKDEEIAVNSVLLRCLKKAKYASDNIGHFGLASNHYCHFTSPIRRYPDLENHRIIKKMIDKEMGERIVKELKDDLDDIANHSTSREVRAQELEYESVKIKKVKYMEDKIGEEYEGFISGVTEYGLYIQLDNTVEGLIHISKLNDDYYIFEPEQFTLIGENTGRTFKLGDKLKIIVDKVDVFKKEIDFSIL